MDISQQITLIRRAYGGSDRAAPSINAPQYVRHGSNRDPLDLGVIPDGDLFIEGELGAQLGTQTLFFRFSLAEPAKLAGRVAPTQRYTDQYLSFVINDSAGDRLLGNGEDYQVVPFPFFASDSSSPVLDAQSYVANGYWQDGYAISEGFGERSAAAAVVVEPRLVPTGAPLPAGQYQAVLSSTQWTGLRFQLQLSGRGTVHLGGEAQGNLSLAGRTSPARLRGEATLPLRPRGRIARPVQLGGEATVGITPSATLSRISPFGL
jgi:hypothetical protein